MRAMAALVSLASIGAHLSWSAVRGTARLAMAAIDTAAAAHVWRRGRLHVGSVYLLPGQAVRS